MNSLVLFIPRMHEEISLAFCSSYLPKMGAKSFNPFFNDILQDFSLNSLPMSRENALAYFEDLQRVSRDISPDAPAFMSKCQEEVFREGELNSLANFSKEIFTETEEKLNENSQKIKELERLQKFLLLAFLQEEQEMELFFLEKSIAEKEISVQNLLKNPFEDSPLEKIVEHKKEIQESFSFNVLREEKNKQNQILSLSKKDLVNFSVTSSWERIFFAQLAFIPENASLIVNDKKMHEDLLAFALQKNLIQNENARQDEINTLYSDYHFFSCHSQLLFSDKKICNISGDFHKKLNFLLKKD